MEAAKTYPVDADGNCQRVKDSNTVDIIPNTIWTGNIVHLPWVHEKYRYIDIISLDTGLTYPMDISLYLNLLRSNGESGGRLHDEWTVGKAGFGYYCIIPTRYVDNDTVCNRCGYTIEPQPTCSGCGKWH